MKNDMGSCIKKAVIKIKIEKLNRKREQTIESLIAMFPETIEKIEKIENLMPEKFKRIDLEIKNLEKVLKFSKNRKKKCYC